MDYFATWPTISMGAQTSAEVLLPRSWPGVSKIWRALSEPARAFAISRSSLIDARQPDLWVHGHLRSRADYRIDATRIVCNPRGHIEEDSAKTFDPCFTIDISAA